MIDTQVEEGHRKHCSPRCGCRSLAEKAMKVLAVDAYPTTDSEVEPVRDIERAKDVPGENICTEPENT